MKIVLECLTHWNRLNHSDSKITRFSMINH